MLHYMYVYKIIYLLKQFELTLDRRRKEFSGLSFWIYEKRRKNIDDVEPRYEGTVIEFFQRMKVIKLLRNYLIFNY